MARLQNARRAAPRLVLCALAVSGLAALAPAAGGAPGTGPATIQSLAAPPAGPARKPRKRRRAPAAAPRPPVVVAIVDSGADVAHPALAGHLWLNPKEQPGNGVDDDGDGIVDDVNGADFLGHDGVLTDTSGHGTHVAGIVAATDPAARLMILKVGSGEWIDVGAATAAVYYAVAHGARVVNLSWAFHQGDPGLAQAIAYAGAHGVLVVAAAGNFGSSNDLLPTFPGSYAGDTVLSVAATCDGVALAPFSDYGKLSVSLAAPGCAITSSLPGGRYGALSGTSMASPAVAGAAALLLERRPDASPQELADALLGGARPAPALAGTVASGATLDVAGALAALAAPDRALPDAFRALAPASSFTATLDPTYYYDDVSFSWTPSSDPDLAGYRIVLDGTAVAAVAPGVTSTVVHVAPGGHAWSVEAYDRSGNVRTASPPGAG